MRRTKDPCKGQKMESHDHRTPVGGEVGTMESIRQDRNKRDCKGLHQHDEDKPFADSLPRGINYSRALFTELAATMNEID